MSLVLSWSIPVDQTTTTKTQEPNNGLKEYAGGVTVRKKKEKKEKRRRKGREFKISIINSELETRANTTQQLFSSVFSAPLSIVHQLMMHTQSYLSRSMQYTLSSMLFSVSFSSLCSNHAHKIVIIQCSSAYCIQVF